MKTMKPLPLDLGTPLFIETLREILNVACPDPRVREQVMTQVIDRVQERSDKIMKAIRTNPSARDLVIEGTVKQWQDAIYSRIRGFANSVTNCPT